MSNRTYLCVEKTLKDVGYIFRRLVSIVAVRRIVDGESVGIFTRVEREAEEVVIGLLHELVGKQRWRDPGNVVFRAGMRACRALGLDRGWTMGDFSCRLFRDYIVLGGPRTLGRARKFGFDGSTFGFFSGGSGSTA
jgi:hypothetical protein